MLNISGLIEYRKGAYAAAYMFRIKFGYFKVDMIYLGIMCKHIVKS